MAGDKKAYEYAEALKLSIEYFGGEDLPAKVFLDKYALRDNEGVLLEATPDDMFERIAFEIARVEKNKFKEPWTKEEIKEFIQGFKRIIPQGSPMYGLGNTYQYVSLSNCFVIEPPVDSYGGICLADQEIVQISKRRGGIGTDISHLRPSGSPTTNAAKTSTGILSFMDRYSRTIREVGQFGRRGALLISLSVHHPEIIDFTTVKRDLTKITGANISIRLSDEFLEAVKKGTTYEQRFPVDSKNPKISQQVDAREVWAKIIENAHAMAEPGLLFWDTIIRESPADCYSDKGFKSQSTNPCGEVILCPNDSCRLLLLNLLTYVINPFTKRAEFDHNSFKADAKIAQRLQDDIIDLEIESLKRIVEKIKNDPEESRVKTVELELWEKTIEKAEMGRRTGTGITALGDALAALGVSYGSTKSISIVNEIYKTLKLGTYESSVDMAKELGPFPIWDFEKEKKNPFLLRIKDEDPILYKKMKKYGRRNIAIGTTAPAGCLEENTRIRTDRGLISFKDLFEINNIDIEDLREKHNLWFDCDEEVYVYDVNNNKHKINKLYWKGYTNGYDFKFYSEKNIKTSKDHKFLVLIDKDIAEWRKAEDLKINDKIVKLIEE